jgi:hypothetical protein
VKAIGIDQPEIRRNGSSSRFTGWTANSDQPCSSSMVQKLLNFMAAWPSRPNGAPGNWLAPWKLSGARGCPGVSGLAMSQFQENAPWSTDTSHGSKIMKP